MPPLRRIYTAALQQGAIAREKMAEVDRLSAEPERLTAELAAVTEQREIEREQATHRLLAERERLSAELAAIIGHRDALKVHLVMQQCENERQIARAAEDLERVRQLESQLQSLRQGQVTPADLDLLYSKLAAQITRLSADLVS